MQDSRKAMSIAAAIAFVALVAMLAAVCGGEFRDDFEFGEASTEIWQYDRAGECEIDVVPGPEQGDGKVVRFAAGPRARCELVPRVFRGIIGDYLREPFDEDRWYAFRLYLQEPWEPNQRNEVVAQWHSTRDKLFGDTNGRGPPLAIRVIGDYFRISYGWDNSFISPEQHLARYTLWHGPLITGRWVDWVFKIRWSYDDDGAIQVWQDGKLIVDHVGPNTYNDIRGNYLKLGSYHPAVPRTVILDDVYVGSNDPRNARKGSEPEAIVPEARR